MNRMFGLGPCVESAAIRIDLVCASPLHVKVGARAAEPHPRLGSRASPQAPGFSVVVTLTIALGVGATTAIFTIVDAVLLRPLPYPAQTSLVTLFDTNRGHDAAVLSFPEFIDWRDRGSDVFESRTPRPGQSIC